MQIVFRAFGFVVPDDEAQRHFHPLESVFRPRARDGLHDDERSIIVFSRLRGGPPADGYGDGPRLGGLPVPPVPRAGQQGQVFKLGHQTIADSLQQQKGVHRFSSR